MQAKVCIAISCALLMALSAAARDVFEEIPFDKDGEIAIENRKGSVTVKAWDEPLVIVEASLGSGVDDLEISGDDDDLSIKVNYPRGLFRRAGETKIEVTVPRGCSVKIESASAQISITGVTGEIQAETRNGSIRIQECSSREVRAETVNGSVRVYGDLGSVEANTISGSIEVHGASKEVRAESVSGRIEIQGTPTRVKASTVNGSLTLEGASGEVSLETVSGSIRVEGDRFDECNAATVSGSIRWTGLLDLDGEMEFDTHSGSITLNFLREPSAEFILESFSGGIDVDLPISGRHKGRRNLRFPALDGDGEVKATTFSGSINIRSE